MWTLDKVNNRRLIDALGPHWRQPHTETVRVGEGWRDLVAECHEQVVSTFPTYELVNVKQKYGALEFQAFPWKRTPETADWTTAELSQLDRITDRYRDRSEAVCEWCGQPGELRTGRTIMLTLCDVHHAAFHDPPEGWSSRPQT
jgi:hypothetical protein